MFAGAFQSAGHVFVTSLPVIALWTISRNAFKVVKSKSPKKTGYRWRLDGFVMISRNRSLSKKFIFFFFLSFLFCFSLLSSPLSRVFYVPRFFFLAFVCRRIMTHCCDVSRTTTTDVSRILRITGAPLVFRDSSRVRHSSNRLISLLFLSFSFCLLFFIPAICALIKILFLW